MTQPYFRYLPNFEYVSRLPNSKNISDYIQVKNIFRRAKLNDEIFQNLAFFSKYKIIGDERPDNIAYKVYNDENLDWLILITNNIINVEEEWPLSQDSFYNFMISKYGSETNFNNPHHYETIQIKDSVGNILVQRGLEVPSTFTFRYYDSGLNQMVTKTNATSMVTNYEYEDKIQDSKRNIYILKAKYLSIILEELEDNLLYQSGSSQYVNDNLAVGENIRLYE
jgi:hypothetical protein